AGISARTATWAALLGLQPSFAGGSAAVHTGQHPVSPRRDPRPALPGGAGYTWFTRSSMGVRTDAPFARLTIEWHPGRLRPRDARDHKRTEDPDAGWRHRPERAHRDRGRRRFPCSAPDGRAQAPWLGGSRCERASVLRPTRNPGAAPGRTRRVPG